MNMLCMTTMNLIAQTTVPIPKTGTPSPLAGLFPVALMMAMIVFLFLTMRSQKKREKREKDDLHSRMKKGDRVLTVGGVVGAIMSVKENEVVVKVDETTNTKMTFIKSAIQKIVDD